MNFNIIKYAGVSSLVLALYTSPLKATDVEENEKIQKTTVRLKNFQGTMDHYNEQAGPVSKITLSASSTPQKIRFQKEQISFQNWELSDVSNPHKIHVDFDLYPQLFQEGVELSAEKETQDSVFKDKNFGGHPVLNGIKKAEFRVPGSKTLFVKMDSDEDTVDMITYLTHKETEEEEEKKSSISFFFNAHNIQFTDQPEEEVKEETLETSHVALVQGEPEAQEETVSPSEETHVQNVTTEHKEECLEDIQEDITSSQVITEQQDVELKEEEFLEEKDHHETSGEQPYDVPSELLNTVHPEFSEVREDTFAEEKQEAPSIVSEEQILKSEEPQEDKEKSLVQEFLGKLNALKSEFEEKLNS